MNTHFQILPAQIRFGMPVTEAYNEEFARKLAGRQKGPAGIIPKDDEEALKLVVSPCDATPNATHRVVTGDDVETLKERPGFEAIG